jgi:hypothetical protein
MNHASDISDSDMIDMNDDDASDISDGKQIKPQFDFVIDGETLETSLSKFIARKNLSTESGILIEVKTQEPQEKSTRKGAEIFKAKGAQTRKGAKILLCPPLKSCVI